MPSLLGRKFPVFAALSLLFSLTVVPASAWDPNSHYDNQIWPEIKTTTHLSQYLDFILNSQLRVGRDISTLVREQGEVGFDLNANKHVNLSARYLSIGHQPTENNKTYENRFQFYPTIRLSLGSLKIDAINMFEYRFRYPVANSVRYRPSLTLEHPFAPKDLKLSAYIKVELFYSTQYEKFYRLRSYVGWKKKVHRNITLELYYCRQQDGKSNPGNLNIIGTVVALDFNLPGS